MSGSHAAAPPPISRVSSGRMGMALFLFGDAVTFTLLIVGHLYLRRHAPQGAPHLDLSGTLVFSVLLWASSGTLWAAERLRDVPRVSGVLYALTGLLGLTFVAGTLQEWLQLVQAGYGVSSTLFFTGYYTLTGLHALHVLLGALALLVLAALRFRDRLGWRRRGVTDALGLYWHFVDAVWVLLFLLLYVWRGP
ncbi:cytochrome c oxidase subunit 3 [Deinococcus aquiradiocola]|uniref:Heme-copper oxidase subunit III family profile domain-containing protein n=1 Tax=Deinococcus aquiradiocola TaxID=393059 RepID=A0A917PFY4_9DEIO|nr:cytochrome c oxidase subunit 3 [Deinococcus aquiradiocola]GGJ75931.1 hypothetical protein GCM10008939_20170 [Deinococcus aquiradiocola]